MVTFQLYCLLPLRDRKILEKDLEALVFMYCELAQKRYVSQRSQRRRPTNKFAIDLMHTNIINPEVPWLNEIEFLNGYRMTKLAFARLVRAIENHPCFRNIRGPLQQPVAYQVMVLLHYLGSAGSGASSHRARNHFHVGYGTVSNYRRRVITAIREYLRPLYYSWPNANERAKISSEIQQEFLLPNCVGAIDGTTFQLTTKPRRYDASDFKGRKDGYTISGLFLFDNRRKIRYYNTGWAGSAHDNRIFTNSGLYQRARDYFSQNEYVVGDSAFQEERFCVPSYRNPTGGTLTGTKAGFNTVLGRIRVVSEHGFGHLKGRFPILSNIPIMLTQDVRSMWEILDMIDTCVILHNFILSHNENTDEPFFYMPRQQSQIRDPVGPLAENDELNQELAIDSPRGLRREQLRAYLSENNLI